MNKFYVLKESETFSDTTECIGLASIINGIFQQNNPNDLPEILIEDKGFCYQISINRELTDDIIDNCKYFDFFKYIGKKSNDPNIIKYYGIDYENEQKIRKNYYDSIKNKIKIDENPTHKNYDLIRMLANMNGYEKSFYNCRYWQNNFNQLLKFIFQLYSNINDNRIDIKKQINQFAKNQNIKIDKINSLQDINPDKGKGANQSKTNGISPKGQANDWITQLVRFTGVWDSFVSKYFDKDIKNYCLVPNNISYDRLRKVYKSFKPLIRGKGSIKVDILMIQLMTIELIKYDKYNISDLMWGSPKDKISGFQFAYYKNLGQRPAVTNIGFLGLPDFINIKNENDGLQWIKILEEHKDILSNIDEKNSSNVSMLQNYRQFISSSDFSYFFNFMYGYASYLSSSLSNKKIFIKAFTEQNMEVIMQTQKSYMEIIDNSGFLAIAEAIRNCTIIPIIHKNKKDVVFGLSQKIKIASRDKDSLMIEISEFVNKYNETVMLKDYHKKIHKKYITTEDLEKFYQLMDENYSSKLIAGLLISYGYAKNPSTPTNNENTNKGESK